MEAAKDFTKPFEVPQRSIRTNVYVNFISTSLKTLGREGLNKPKVETKDCRFVKYAWPLVTTIPGVKGLRN